jgi:hypothetical protein
MIDFKPKQQQQRMQQNQKQKKQGKAGAAPSPNFVEPFGSAIEALPSNLGLGSCLIIVALLIIDEIEYSL